MNDEKSRYEKINKEFIEHSLVVKNLAQSPWLVKDFHQQYAWLMILESDLNQAKRNYLTAALTKNYPTINL